MTKQHGGVILAGARNIFGYGFFNTQRKVRSSTTASSFSIALIIWPMGSRAAHRLMLATASSARTGSPSWNLSPGRSRNVQTRPSADTSSASTIWRLHLEVGVHAIQHVPDQEPGVARDVGGTPDRIEVGDVRMGHETPRPRGGALRDRRGRESARRGQDAGTCYRLQECSSVHEVHVPATASHRAASMIGAGVGAAAGQRRLSPRRQATLPTPQKNGSGPLTTPLTFLRQAW